MSFPNAFISLSATSKTIKSFPVAPMTCKPTGRLTFFVDLSVVVVKPTGKAVVGKPKSTDKCDQNKASP